VLTDIQSDLCRKVSARLLPSTVRYSAENFIFVELATRRLYFSPENKANLHRTSVDLVQVVELYP